MLNIVLQLLVIFNIMNNNFDEGTKTCQISDLEWSNLGRLKMYGNYAPVEDVAEEASGSFDIQGLMRVAQHVSSQSNVALTNHF